MEDYRKMKKYLAEFLGTFILTFMVCGAVSFTGGYAGYLGVVGIALTAGFTVAVLLYVFGTVSGAHCNPAVSAGMLIAGRLSVVDFMGYVVSQVFGALAAAFALYGLSKSFDAQVISQYQSYGYDLVGLGTNGYADTSAFLKINVWGAFVTELLLTFVFVLAFLCVTAKTAYKNVAGLVAGMAFCMAELFGLVLTGAGINPAKSFGTAFVKAVFGDVKALSQVWVFLVAPLAGGLLAGLCNLYFYGKPRKKISRKETDEKEALELLEKEETTER